MRKIVSTIVLVAFFCVSIKSYADFPMAVDQMPRLPTSEGRIQLSPKFIPAHLQGMIIHQDNALKFDFLIQKGDQNIAAGDKIEEYRKLIKYFLAALTIPDEDQWVNLSPYEKDRIIKDDFAKTQMGQDLLAQDYMLKQITSSLIYPEDGLGKKFWDKIYERAWKEFHTTKVPVSTFNKVWIIPDQAYIYESGNTAYILQSHLKVMLQEDYLSLIKHDGRMISVPTNINQLGSQMIRAIILPELEHEINEGKNFANLRQMYSGMILAAWYKKALKESFLAMAYANKAKTAGFTSDPSQIKMIYREYLKAFKRGVFNYIKQDIDKYSRQSVPRKYFSGGWKGFDRAEIVGAKTDFGIRNTLYIADRAAVSLIPVSVRNTALGEISSLDRAAVVLSPRQSDEGKSDKAQLRISELTKVHPLLKESEIMTTFKIIQYAAGTVKKRIKGLKIHKDINELSKWIGRYQRAVKKAGKNIDKKVLEEELIGRAKSFSTQLNAILLLIEVVEVNLEDQKTIVFRDTFYDFSDKIRKMIQCLNDITDSPFPLERKIEIAMTFKKRFVQYVRMLDDVINPQEMDKTISRKGNEAKGYPEYIYIFLRYADPENQKKYGILKNMAVEIQAEMSRQGVEDLLYSIKLRSVRKKNQVQEIMEFKTQLETLFNKLGEVLKVVNKYRDDPSNKGLKLRPDEGLFYDFYDKIQKMQMHIKLQIGEIDRMVSNGEYLKRKSIVDIHYISKLQRILLFYLQMLRDIVNLEGMDRRIDRKGFESQGFPEHTYDFLYLIPKQDQAMSGVIEQGKNGGVDFNSSYINLLVKRDGQGVPLIFAKQDMAQINRIQGFEPEILEIKAVVNLPILSELRGIL